MRVLFCYIFPEWLPRKPTAGPGAAAPHTPPAHSFRHFLQIPWRRFQDESAGK